MTGVQTCALPICVDLGEADCTPFVILSYELAKPIIKVLRVVIGVLADLSDVASVIIAVSQNLAAVIDRLYTIGFD